MSTTETQPEPPMTVDRVIEILHNIFNEDRDSIAIAFEILREEGEE